MTAARLCIIRHGETHWNTGRRIQGHTDTLLNDAGRAQAEALRDTLAGERFAAIYSSDLQRALDTAAPLSAAHGLPVQPVKALRERCFGAFEGLTRLEMADRFPDEYALFMRMTPEYTPPGSGESMAVFSARIRDALTDIAERHAGVTVAVLTHGGALDVAYRLSTGQPLQGQRTWPAPNAAPNWIEYAQGRWTLIRWAEEPG